MIYSDYIFVVVINTSVGLSAATVGLNAAARCLTVTASMLPVVMETEKPQCFSFSQVTINSSESFHVFMVSF